MTDTGVDAHLDLICGADGLAIHGFVAAAPPRDLRWRLVITSSSAGGTSNVSQSGRTSGAGGDPVGTVTVTPNSQGSVELSVFEGDRQVAKEIADLGAVSAPNGMPPACP